MRRLVLRAAALSIVVACAKTGRAQSSPAGDGATVRITEDGLQCGTTTYDVDWLSPSIFGANDLRRERLRTLTFRANELTTANLCTPDVAHVPQPGLPGCATVVAWSAAVAEAWPTLDTPDYIAKRVDRMAGDDDMEADSLRAMAHKKCLDEMSNPTNPGTVVPKMPQDQGLCAALVGQEEAADPTLKSRIASSLLPEPKPAAHAIPGAVPDHGRVTFGIGGSTYTLDPGVVQLIDPTLLSPSARPADDDKKARDRVAVLNAAIPVAVFYRDLWCTAHPPGAVASIVTFCGTPLPVARARWAFGSPGIASAARELGPFEPAASWQVPARVPDVTGKELAAIDERSKFDPQNPQSTQCQAADFYVAPTHQVVRKNVDNMVADTFSVCVDTAGFATDEPVQVEVSTPSAQQVEWLWPGEPKTIRAPMSDKSRAQVMHLTVSGYPRREILRAAARNKGGPLEHNDIFAYISDAATAGKKADETKVLKGIGSKLFTDSHVISDLKAVSDALAAPIGPAGDWPAKLGDACKKAVQTLKGDSQKLSDAEQAALSKYVPEQVEFDEALTPGTLTPLANKLAQLGAILTGATQASPPPAALQPDAATAALELCDITWVLVPLVSEDILVESCSAESRDAPYVLEYDFGGGFLVATPGRAQETVPIFAVVRNVQPGWSVGIAINDKAVIQRDATIVGFTHAGAPDATFNERASASRSGFDHVNALAIEMQPPNTQILALGYLSGGARYDLTVCASDGPYDDCTASSGATVAPTHAAPPVPPPGAGSATTPAAPAPAAPDVSPSNHRIVAKNSITIHAKHYIGARLGLGMVASFGGFQDLVTEPGVPGSVVRNRKDDIDVALPLLFAVYVGGRDATEMPPPLSGGPVFGLDLTKVSANPRLYAGLVVDVYGFGVTLTASGERVAYVENDEGTVIGPTSSAQTDNVWRFGASAALTTDLDIFQAIFQNYFKSSSFPSVTSQGLK